MNIRDLSLDRLQREFGAPDSETHDLRCWHVCPGYDMIAQRQTAPEEAVIWVPWTDDNALAFGERHPEAELRPMGSYHPCAPSLAPGKMVLRLTIRTTAQLDEAVGEIRRIALHRLESPR